jgi:hypothetical protein
MLDDLSYFATTDHEAEQKGSHAATPPRYCDMYAAVSWTFQTKDR